MLQNHRLIISLCLKKRGKMACQRGMTHSEEERKDGVPKKYDPKKEREKMEMERESVKKKELSFTLCTGLIS